MSTALPAPITPGELIARVGARLGLGIHFESTARTSGQISAPDGRKFYFAGTRMDLNGISAAQLAGNKEACAYYLLRMGYPVPDGRSFRVREIDAGCAYASELGFPVVVKPNHGFSGVHVSIAANEPQLRRAMQALFADPLHRTALVQRKVDGNDFRIVILDGEVLAAYQRVPLAVVGDGRRATGALLEEKIAALTARKRHLILAPRDVRVTLQLERLGLAWEAIPGLGERIQLLDTANGSTGADLVDLTVKIHPEVCALCARIARDAGLRYCGIDLMTGTIEEPLADYVIIELNASPAIYHLLGLGSHEQHLAESIIEKMLLAMTRQ